MEKDIAVDQPLVSICIPVYNAAQYITETLDCLREQSYKNLEIIAVDDSSTDESLSLLKEIALKDSRLIVLQQENGGASAARNHAFVHSKGTLIKFFDADDLLDVTAIEKQVELARKNSGSVITGKWGRFFNNDLKTFRLSPEKVWKNMNCIDWLVESWSKGESMTQPGIFLLPRTLIEKVGLWDTSLTLVDDLEFFSKIILNAEGVVFCNDFILYYRSGLQNNLSGRKSGAAYESALSAIQKGTSYLLEKEKSLRTKKSSAALFQSLAYSTYLSCPSVFKTAERMAKELGGSDIPYPAGGITKVLVSMLGWKIASKIKKTINR